MRWCTYISPAGAAARVGLLHEGSIHGLPGADSLVDLLGDDGQRMADAAERARNDPAEVIAEGDVRLLAPVPRPPSVRDFFAFEEHVKTGSRAMGQDVNPVWYEIPLFYFTNPAATRGPYDDIPIAPGSRAFGDIIGSGTVGTGCILELSGVHGRDGNPWLRPGDLVHLEVERLGVITSTIIPGAPLIPLRA